MRSLHDDVGHTIGFTRGSSNIGIPNKAAPSCTKAAMKSRLRIGEVERESLLQKRISMARLLSMMQLHPDHTDHTDLGFIRKMWILGRLRHLKIID